MNTTLRFLFGLAVILAAGFVIGRLLWRWLKRTEDDPARLVLKWLATLALPVFLIWVGFKVHPIAAVVLGAFFGVFLGIWWTPNIGRFLAGSITDEFDGGREQVEPRPFYSIAQAHRKAGRIRECLEEIDRQLTRFPGDVEGLLLRAEVLAKSERDLPAAAACIEQVAVQATLPAAPRARALLALADWQVAAQARDDARETWERVRTTFPESEFAREAAQRLAHLTGEAWRVPEATPAVLPMVRGDERLGLRQPGYASAEPPRDAHAAAAALQEHLNIHPQDGEAREKLARIYAEELGHLDWAVAQLELLTHQPGVTPRDVARWWHRVADWQIEFAADEAGARRALGQITARFPDTALASQAESRLTHLKLEVRGKTKGRTLRSGPPEDLAASG
ncbi:MAG: tetratricopeptide repeat protein [Limisphaerales bacterium]